VRIISGSAKGRRLSVAPAGTRPTSDRVREALFSSLDSRVNDWSAVRFLDLCAGSGAVGLEALSRGAAAVTLVEHDRRTLDVLRRNAGVVGEGADIVAADARSWSPGPGRFDIVYVDPPYSMSDTDVQAMLEVLTRHSSLEPDAVVIVERSSRSSAPWPQEGWETLRRRDYGDTSLWYGRPMDVSGVPSESQS
jgi:16S rRNA (guanine966-N2)-methyltransferase